MAARLFGACARACFLGFGASGLKFVSPNFDEPLTLVDTDPSSGKALDEPQSQLGEHGHSIDDIELFIVTPREMPAEIVLSGHGEPITDHVTLIDDRIAKYNRRKEKSTS
ncbi:MAG TPA: hypothetical protein VFJ64_06595 [Solirubrobacterales bacterium]|nr:hypothetical protein [Solirubrobacterales bacterium]